MKQISTTEVIGEGIYPDEDRVIAVWNAPLATSTETPIRIQHGPFTGALKPNVETLMPACVAQMLVESGYDVEVKYNAIVNEGIDEEIENAVADIEAQSRIAALVKLPVAKLTEELAALDDDTLAALLAAEQAEGEGKTRKSAVEAIEAAIAAKSAEQAS